MSKSDCSVKIWRMLIDRSQSDGIRVNMTPTAAASPSPSTQAFKPGMKRLSSLTLLLSRLTLSKSSGRRAVQR
jgi:hypothetical protein